MCVCVCVCATGNNTYKKEGFHFHLSVNLGEIRFDGPAEMCYRSPVRLEANDSVEVKIYQPSFSTRASKRETIRNDIKLDQTDSLLWKELTDSTPKANRALSRLLRWTLNTWLKYFRTCSYAAISISKNKPIASCFVHYTLSPPRHEPLLREPEQKAAGRYSHPPPHCGQRNPGDGGGSYRVLTFCTTSDPEREQLLQLNIKNIL